MSSIHSPECTVCCVQCADVTWLQEAQVSRGTFVHTQARCFISLNICNTFQISRLISFIQLRGIYAISPYPSLHLLNISMFYAYFVLSASSSPAACTARRREKEGALKKQRCFPALAGTEPVVTLFAAPGPDLSLRPSEAR